MTVRYPIRLGLLLLLAALIGPLLTRTDWLAPVAFLVGVLAFLRAWEDAFIHLGELPWSRRPPHLPPDRALAALLAGALAGSAVIIGAQLPAALDTDALLHIPELVTNTLIGAGVCLLSGTLLRVRPLLMADMNTPGRA